MKLTTHCPAAGCHAPLRGALSEGAQLICPACGADALRDAAPGWFVDGRVERCPCCDGRELYVRKDFPQRAGLAIVIVAGLAALILFKWNVLWALGVLAGVVVIDAVLYLFVPLVTVCYRCRTEFRGVVRNPDHHPFDLATAEKYPHPDAAAEPPPS